jgi:hypothetical protein
MGHQNWIAVVDSACSGRTPAAQLVKVAADAALGVRALRPRSDSFHSSTLISEPEAPHSPVVAGLPSSCSGPRCASFRGIGSSRTSSKNHRASPCGHSLRRRTSSFSIAGASAGIRCPSHNKDSAQSHLTFVLALLASRRAHRRNPASTTADQQGRHREILSLLD